MSADFEIPIYVSRVCKDIFSTCGYLLALAIHGSLEWQMCQIGLMLFIILVLLVYIRLLIIYLHCAKL